MECWVARLLSIELQPNAVQALHADQLSHIGLCLFLVVLQLKDGREFEVSYFVARLLQLLFVFTKHISLVIDNALYALELHVVIGLHRH